MLHFCIIFTRLSNSITCRNVMNGNNGSIRGKEGRQGNGVRWQRKATVTRMQTCTTLVLHFILFRQYYQYYSNSLTPVRLELSIQFTRRAHVVGQWVVQCTFSEHINDVSQEDRDVMRPRLHLIRCYPHTLRAWHAASSYPPFHVCNVRFMTWITLPQTTSANDSRVGYR